ncbi:MAG: hypothetical protein FJZ01_15270 [Candidatus Sericytochromatia bacterium]|nr:hypothetical protein [Candidatus Tanganyikabacteria bacterium]
METEDKRKPGRKRPASRRRRKRPEPAPYNPGQVCLLMDLLSEFAGSREVAAVPGGETVAVVLSSDIPHLDTFFEYKMIDLSRQQQRLARLWALSEAV